MKDIIKETKDENEALVKNVMAKARQHIERAIEQSGPFSHNLASIALQQVAGAIGTKYANELVDEFDLEDLYGIPKQSE